MDSSFDVVVESSDDLGKSDWIIEQTLKGVLLKYNLIDRQHMLNRYFSVISLL